MGSNKNNNLNKARAAKNDEFYTQLNDINNELRHYRHHFKDKVIFCNCDDPEWSNFWKYFTLNFDFFGMKKLIATHYVENGQSYKLEFLPGDKPSFLPSDTFRKTPLQGNGDFRSDECVEILKEADVVVTNPPFSLFREYVAQLMEHEKKFIVIGSDNAVTYKEIFQHIKSDKIWRGLTKVKEFLAPSEDGNQEVKKFGNIGWYTNMDFEKRHEEIILYKEYYGNEEDFPKYDNYDAINIDKTKDIPIDYDGVMGVPISFLDKYCPDQFEIVGVTQSWYGAASKIYPKQLQISGKDSPQTVSKLNDGAAIKVPTPPVGKTYYKVGDDFFTKSYARILIRRRASS